MSSQSTNLSIHPLAQFDWFGSAWPLLALVGVLLVLALLARILARPRKLPYTTRDSLLTRSELKFYRVLVKAVSADWEIFAMVRIADLMRVKKGTRQYRKWLNKILAKHVDFVICDSENLVPLVAIELDDASHNRPDRIERDKLVNEIFQSAGMPLLRIRTAKDYSAREIRAAIEGRIA